MMVSRKTRRLDMQNERVAAKAPGFRPTLLGSADAWGDLPYP